MAMPDGVSRLLFGGRVRRKNAVSVRGSDGLFHYGWLIHKEVDGWLIDFKYGPDRMRIMPFGSVFRLTGVFNDRSKLTCWIETVLKENDRVEVLLQSRSGEPWKWCPGTLLAADFQKGSFGHVSVSLPTDRTAVVVVPGQQIRRPSNDAELEHLLINSTDPVNLVVHYPLPLDFPMNHLPKPILAEIFDCTFTDQQTRMRRVCSLWNDIIVASGGSIVNLHDLRYRNPPYWHSLWNAKTRIVVVDASGYHYNAASGFFLVKNLASLIKQVTDEYGFPRLVGVGLRGMFISEKDSGRFCEKLTSLRDALGFFGSACSFIKLLDPVFNCFRSGPCQLQYELTVSSKWTDASEMGGFERFFASFSVRYNTDTTDEILEAWIRGPTAANSMVRCSGKAVHVPVGDRPGAVNVKHSGMPFPSPVNTGSAVGIRGDDGLLLYARVIAKVNNGLLLDFRNGKPFTFVPFGNVYYYPSSSSELDLSGKPVEVLLRLEPGEPWKWYSAERISAYPPGDRVADYFSLEFVKVSLADGTTVTAMAPRKQVRLAYDAVELEKHLLNNGDHVHAEVHRRLDWEMKVSELSLIVLKQVLDCLDTGTFFKVRAVCKKWDQIVETATFDTIHLLDSVHSSVACLSNVWSKEVSTVIIESMGEDFSSACHLLGHYVRQKGCVPLTALVLVGFIDLLVTYAYGSGFSVDLSVLQSVCQCLIFRHADVDFRVNFDNHMPQGHVLELLSGRIDLTKPDCAADLGTMIGENVEKCQGQLDQIRAYFSLPTRSLECVDYVLELLNDVDKAMYRTADDRKKQCSVKYLLAGQPEKLNGLAVAAVGHAIKRFTAQ